MILLLLLGDSVLRTAACYQRRVRLTDLFKTALVARCDMTDHVEPDDRRLQKDPANPTENADKKDPTDPTERTEPTLPIDSTDPFEAIESIEFSEATDHREDTGTLTRATLTSDQLSSSESPAAQASAPPVRFSAAQPASLSACAAAAER